jgi:hypothetical protein
MKVVIRRLPPDTGFTTIELIISLLVLGLIVGPLTASFVLGIRTAQSVGGSETDSSDAQIAASYFEDDADSADTVSTAASCGGPNTVVQFDWIDGAVHRYAAYVYAPDASAAADLHVSTAYSLQRRYCEASSGPVVQTLRLARALSLVPVAHCDGGSCAAAPKPNTVTLDVTELPGRSTDLAYSFTLTGTRRVTT